MTRLRELLETDVPLIAVSFEDQNPDWLVEEARTEGLDVAELRIDRFSRIDKDYVLNEIEKFSAIPTIATIRTRREGGDWVGTEEQRLNLFRLALRATDAVDVELSSDRILADVLDVARSLDRIVIISYHNFDTTPSLGELERIVLRAKSLGADYVKVSVMANSLSEVQTLALFTLINAERGLISIAMGAEGLVSRIMFPALGSRITYAFIGSRPAPGQLDFRDTFTMLRTFYPRFNQSKIISLQLLEGA